MHAFDLERLASISGDKRTRRMFALGMRDGRRDNYDGEDEVNDGFESDAYWAGRCMRSQVAERRIP